MENKILYGYLRQSKEDTGEGYSIQYQKEVGERIKNRFGFSKIIFFNEGSGVSGTTNPFERKVGRELFDKVQNGEVKHLFVYEWSRLSRDNFFSEYLRKKFIENNVLIYEGDCSEPRNLGNPIDQLTSSILSSIYTYERQNMIKRIKEGLYQSRLNKRWGGVYLPYGYKRDEDGNVIVDEVEMSIYLQMVEFIFEGKSVRWVVNWLNDNSIPTKGERVIKKGYIKRRDVDGELKEINMKSTLWRDNVVRNILTKPYYKGERIDKYGNRFEFPTILDEERWIQLQDKINENKSVNRNGNKPIHNYLLKNLIFCKRDGHKLLGRIKSDERTYYCSKKRKEVRLKGEKPCSLPSPNLDFIEKYVWEKLTDILSNSHLIREEFKNQKLQNQTHRTSVELMEKEVKSIESKINEVEKKKSKIVNLYLDDNIDKETYKVQFDKLRDEEFELREQLKEGRNNLIILGDSKGWIDWVDSFRKEVLSWGENLDFISKREKVEKYIKRIDIDYLDELKKYEIEITLRYPMINDRFEWKDTKKKSLGYKIKKGMDKVKDLVDKSSYQIRSTSVNSILIGGYVELKFKLYPDKGDINYFQEIDFFKLITNYLQLLPHFFTYFFIVYFHYSILI
jgi:site-specific DNA recombinase